MATPDITVMGAGVFGLSIAFECARRGAKVRVIDETGIGAGASGGIVGALAPHTPENWNPKKQFQYESLVLSGTFWKDVENLSGKSTGYGRIGRIQSIESERGLDLALKRAETAKILWKGFATWEVISAQSVKHKPQSSTGKVVLDTLSARIHPKRTCESLKGALLGLGQEVTIGQAKAEGTIVWATGVQGLQALSCELAKPIGNGVKGQALLLDLHLGDSPQLYADGVHFIPHNDGTLAIGSTTEREFTDPTTTDQQLDQLFEKASDLFPTIKDAQILRRWAGVRPRAKSRAPILGGYPDRPGQFIANGGFKIGFGMAPKIANVMADLVLEGRDAIPEGFRVEDNL